MLHYLRIAATALYLTVCVLLIALWVRSQRTADSMQWHSDGGISASSFDGRIELMFDSGKTDYPNMQEGLTYKAFPNLVWAWPGPSTYGFSLATGSPGVRFVQFPHWSPIL